MKYQNILLRWNYVQLFNMDNCNLLEGYKGIFWGLKWYFDVHVRPLSFREGYLWHTCMSPVLKVLRIVISKSEGDSMLDATVIFEHVLVRYKPNQFIFSSWISYKTILFNRICQNFENYHAFDNWHWKR